LWAFSSYLQVTGTLQGLKTCAPSDFLRSGSAMSTHETDSRRNERRKAPRYNYRASLEIEWGSARLKGRTRDISAGGMFIEADDVLWVGAGFRARVAVEKPVWVECLVKRVEPGLGMGVTIRHAEEQGQRHFEDLLAELATGP
jgi:hypothetical protein